MDLQISKARKEQINFKLRRARMKKRWTLEAAAKAAEVSFSTFLRWEQGRQQPNLVSLDQLCKAFDKQPEDLGYGHLIGIDDSSSQVPPSQVSVPPSQISSSGNITTAPQPTNSIPTELPDDRKQTHQPLVDLAKSLFPPGCNPELDKVQSTQKTIHFSCNSKPSKSETNLIRKEFRRRTGWTLGIRQVF